MTAAVLFDYGLTLVTFSFPEAALLAALERYRPAIAGALGRPAPAATELLEGVLRPIEERLDGIGEDEVDYLEFYREAWSAAGLDLPDSLLYEILDQEQLCWDRSIRVASDSLPTLARLRARGVKTGLVSNAPFPPPLMHRQLLGNGIEELMDAVVFSSEVGRRKPAPEIYLAALARLGVAPGEALFVGDKRVEDYDGPRAIGMRALLCTQLVGGQPAAGVPAIARLAELLDHL